MARQFIKSENYQQETVALHQSVVTFAKGIDAVQRVNDQSNTTLIDGQDFVGVFLDKSQIITTTNSKGIQKHFYGLRTTASFGAANMKNKLSVRYTPYGLEAGGAFIPAGMVANPDAGKPSAPKEKLSDAEKAERAKAKLAERLAKEQKKHEEYVAKIQAKMNKA